MQYAISPLDQNAMLLFDILWFFVIHCGTNNSEDIMTPPKREYGPMHEDILRPEYGPLRIINQKELASLLGLSVSTVQKMRKAKGFPPRKAFPGGPKGWLYKDIVAWAESAPIDTEDDDDQQDRVC